MDAGRFATNHNILFFITPHTASTCSCTASMRLIKQTSGLSGNTSADLCK